MSTEDDRRRRRFLEGLVTEDRPIQEVLRAVRRARERGELSNEDASWIASLYEVNLEHHKWDEEVARKAIAGWLARERLPKPPPVPPATRTLQAIVGGAIGAGAGLAVTLIASFLFHGLLEITGARRARVPVVGVLVVLAAPLIGAVLGALLGWNLDMRNAKGRVQRFLDSASMLDRAWIAWGAVWTGIILVAFTLFDPFRRYGYWRGADVFSLAMLWIGPIIAGWVIARLVGWVASGRRE